jgi:DNA-binding MarR family transcriptional regulator
MLEQWHEKLNLIFEILKNKDKRIYFVKITPKEENAINCGLRAMDFATRDEIYRDEIKGVLRTLVNREG